MRKQGSNDRADESLGTRRGKESTKTQSMKSRRDESKGMKHKDVKQDKALFGKMMKKEMPKVVKMAKKGCK